MNNDWEGRTPQPAIEGKPLPKMKREADLFERLDNMEDGRTADKLRKDIENFDLRYVQDHADIAKGYQTILEIALFLGHNHEVRQQCNILIRALEGYAHHRKEYMAVDFPKEIVATIRDGLNGITEAIMPLLDETEQGKIKNLFRDMITNLEKLNAERSSQKRLR